LLEKGMKNPKSTVRIWASPPYSSQEPEYPTRVMSCISTERLLAVAVADAVLITPEEFGHLKGCRDCFEQWAEFIEEWDPRVEEQD
jgi:hypothetical protein